MKLTTTLGEELEGVVFTFDKESNVVVLQLVSETIKTPMSSQSTSTPTQTSPSPPSSSSPSPNLRLQSGEGKHKYAMIRANFIKEALRIEQSASDNGDAHNGSSTLENDSAAITCHAIDMSRVRKREEDNIKQVSEYAKRIGDDVSIEAQDMMDALSKTLPCAWDEEEHGEICDSNSIGSGRGRGIVVMNEVLIKEPYTAASCFSITGNGSTKKEKTSDDEKDLMFLQRVKKMVDQLQKVKKADNQ